MELKGKVNNNLEPSISVKFNNGMEVEFVIDTGFNGSLCLPRSMMPELGLKKDLEEEIFGIGSHKQLLDISIAKVIWFDEILTLNVLINDGEDKLLGSQLLNNKMLNINYKDKTVTISY